MKMKNSRLTLLLCTLWFVCLNLISAQTNVHYWNFNDNTSEASILTPAYSLVSGASITHIAGGTSLIDFAGGTGQNFDVQNLNARNGDEAGTHLRFNNPIGGELVFSLPTTGFQDVIIQFATRRSGSGAGLQYWSYTVDGLNFISFDTVAPNNGDPMLETLDFTSIGEVNNNAQFKLKVSFDQGPGGTVGNNRFDNFTLDGKQVATPELVHYWNFNDNISEAALLTPSQTLVSGASIAHIAGGTSLIDFAGGNGQNFDAQNLNARNGDEAGTHLRFNNPIGGELIFSLPTTGFQDVIIQFATRRSGSGAGNQYWSFSFDGLNYIAFDTVVPNNGDPMLETFDFTGIEDVNDNAEFKLKVTFDQGPGGAVGNNRFDNFTLDAVSLGGGDNIAPVVVFEPRDQTVNVPIDVLPTLTFNELIRMTDDTPIDNNNVTSLIQFRLDDTNGVDVPFTATFANNIITISPVSPLLNNQSYYLALLENRVEDLSDNAISTRQAISFKTISLQTQFNAGDMVFVAYRMNATNTEDEIALLTLVDIIPGTFINLTDAKYTTNAQPQCQGGIVWTAPDNECIPAGTVITIQTDGLMANKGSVTGSGFGLSSNGDQVIVYTGTPANPNYITALSSNGWIDNNTSCSGSLSSIPQGLVDGVNALNLSSAPGNATGNSVNAYYNGIQAGSPLELRNLILDPNNWLAVGSSTPPQDWPTFVFPGPPTVNEASVTSISTIQLIFNADLNESSASDVNNYSGIPGLLTAVPTSNGTLVDTVLLTYNAPFSNGINYSLTVNNILAENTIQMACPFTFSFAYNTEVSYRSNFTVVEEDAGMLQLVLDITNPAPCTLDVEVLGTPYSTADNEDFDFSTQTINLDGSASIYEFTLEIIDDNVEEQAAEYFVILLKNATGCSIQGDTMATFYIRDNDRKAPVPSQDVELTFVGSFDPSGTSNSTCEVVAYDPDSKRLFSSSAVGGYLDIIDFSNPKALHLIKSVEINSYGGITSVAVNNGILALASPNPNQELDGSVVFFDTDGNFKSQVTVGALPDMITFSPDGTKVLTANEGQPTFDYSIDPEGSVSIIDVTPGLENISQANVTTLYFTEYNVLESVLIAEGVRKLKLSSTLSQDFEPEYITINESSTRAWVTLQENNAIAEIDLQTLSVTDIWALGTKDVNVPGNGFDISDNNNEILIANWPIQAFYIPDAVAHYSVGNKNYIITANEGDEKEYSGFEERTTIGAGSYVLDPEKFPHAAILKKSFNAGRMRVTNLHGDTDNDGDFDNIHCVGSRSFTIWDADAKEIVFDSGDDFEMYTAANFPALIALSPVS